MVRQMGDVLQGIMIPVEWVESAKLHPSIG
jgi:hypothetical protein